MSAVNKDGQIDFAGWSQESREDVLNLKAQLATNVTKIEEMREERKKARSKGNDDEFLRIDYELANLARQNRSIKGKINYRIKKGGKITKRTRRNKYTHEERGKILITNLTCC